jgi:hypothetical protein
MIHHSNVGSGAAAALPVTPCCDFTLLDKGAL